jgi:DNA polymerase-1
MSPFEIIDQLRSQGFRLRVVGDRIGITPIARLTDEQRQLIVDNREALLRLLAGPYTLVTTPAGLDALRVDLACHATVAVDTETTGLRAYQHRLRLLQLAVPGRVWVIDHFQVGDAIKTLWPVLASCTLVLHNAPFDYGFLGRLGYTPGATVDLVILSRLLTASGTRVDNSLAACAWRHLGRTLDKTYQKAKWDGELPAEQVAYAAYDAVTTLDLRAPMQAAIDQAGLRAVADAEHHALHPILWMARSGVAVNRDAWQQQADVDAAEEQELHQVLDVAGPPFPAVVLPEGSKKKKVPTAWNWNSPKQVIKAFALENVTLKSTAKASMVHVKHPLGAKYRAWKAAKTRVSKFGHKWLRQLADDGRMYANWTPIGAVTGRMSCADKNLQQIPRGERRQCLIAPEGRVLVKADWSQLHLRIIADVAPEPVWLDAFDRGLDMHAVTAQRVSGKEEVSKEDRQRAKALNFGLCYGMGVPKFRDYAKKDYDLDLSEEEAKGLRDRFFQAYPGLRQWHRRQVDGPETIVSPSGRRCLDVERFSDKLSYRILLVEADCLKDALRLVWERRHLVPGAWLVLACHDELVMECALAQVDVVIAWLATLMLDAAAPHLMPVPVEVETSAGITWGGGEVRPKQKHRRNSV